MFLIVAVYNANFICICVSLHFINTWRPDIYDWNVGEYLSNAFILRSLSYFEENSRNNIPGGSVSKSLREPMVTLLNNIYCQTSNIRRITVGKQFWWKSLPCDTAIVDNNHLNKFRTFIINSLAPGVSECDSKYVIFNLVLLIGIFRSSHDNALRWMPQDITDDKSTLVQVMAWSRQAASHYLSHCLLSSLSPYGIARPQWVNSLWSSDAIWRHRFGSRLAQVMACCLTASSHYQCWLNISKVQWH